MSHITIHFPSLVNHTFFSPLFQTIMIDFKLETITCPLLGPHNLMHSIFVVSLQEIVSFSKPFI